MDKQREIIEEFLIESNESLVQLDQDFVALEKSPDDQDLLSSIFRAIHTIKGVSGFLGFATLGAVTHGAESILSQLRDGDRKRNRPECNLRWRRKSLSADWRAAGLTKRLSPKR